MFHVQFAGLFMFPVCIKIDTPSSCCSLVISVKLETTFLHGHHVVVVVVVSHFHCRFKNRIFYEHILLSRLQDTVALNDADIARTSTSSYSILYSRTVQHLSIHTRRLVDLQSKCS
jgi:hypothetical protein